MQDEIKKLRENLDKLEELTNRLGYLLREIEIVIGGKDGQDRNITIDAISSNDS